MPHYGSTGSFTIDGAGGASAACVYGGESVWARRLIGEAAREGETLGARLSWTLALGGGGGVKATSVVGRGTAQQQWLLLGARSGDGCGRTRRWADGGPDDDGAEKSCWGARVRWRGC